MYRDTYIAHEPSADLKERFLLVPLKASFDVDMKQSAVALSNNRVVISFATLQYIEHHNISVQ